jgi:hypothetical protein
MTKYEYATVPLLSHATKAILDTLVAYMKRPLA